jgi:hypothetical protein
MVLRAATDLKDLNLFDWHSYNIEERKQTNIMRHNKNNSFVIFTQLAIYVHKSSGQRQVILQSIKKL